MLQKHPGKKKQINQSGFQARGTNPTLSARLPDPESPFASAVGRINIANLDSSYGGSNKAPLTTQHRQHSPLAPTKMTQTFFFLAESGVYTPEAVEHRHAEAQAHGG